MRIEQVAIPLVRGIVSVPPLARLFGKLDKWGNQFDPAEIANPYPSWERIRAEAPVAWHGLYQQWMVTGYDEVQQVLSSPDVCTSGQVEMLKTVRPYSKLTDEARQFWTGWLLLVDPPDHTRLRKLVSKAFTPRQVAAMEPRVDHMVRQMMTDLPELEAPDLVQHLTAPLPINVIMSMLGIPEERWQWARDLTTEVIALLNPFEYFDAATVSAAVAESLAYFGELCDERHARPQDDLITALVQAEDEGDRLDRFELVTMIFFLMGAGHETTTGALGNAIVALAQNPDQRDLIRRQPDLWPNAVEELLRYDTAITKDARTATADLVVGDVTIGAGDNILLYLGAANRDPRRYERPNDLLLDRDDPRPISFGHGIHYCVGAALARMEMRVGLRAFLGAFGDYTVDLDAVEWKNSAILRGPTRLPVTPG